jgi:hypothetical protein
MFDCLLQPTNKTQTMLAKNMFFIKPPKTIHRECALISGPAECGGDLNVRRWKTRLAASGAAAASERCPIQVARTHGWVKPIA